LSFRPQSGTYKNKQRRTQSATTTSSPWGQTAASASAAATPGSTGLIFVSQKGKPQPLRVHIDLVSGTQAAVTPLRGTLSAGDSVIVSSGAASASHRQMSAALNAGAPGGMGSIGRAIH
jgi:hypothetical protein